MEVIQIPDMWLQKKEDSRSCNQFIQRFCLKYDL